MPEMSPTARALRTLELVQDNPGITAGRLGGLLGVSERAARRYVASLRDSGVVIESVRGPYGGFRVGRGLRLPPLTFSSAEALGLVMAVLDGHHHPADTSDPVGSALGKIIRALPAAVAAQAEAVRRSTAPAPDTAAARPDPATASALVQACAEYRRVRIAYCSEAGSHWSAEVDPWAVVVRHGRWYLLCHSHAADAQRAYRIDRVQAVDVVDGTFARPADLDPVRLLEEHLATGWEYDTEVLIDGPLEAVAACARPALGRLEPAGPDTTRLVGSTSNPGWYAEQLAVLPMSFRIVRCVELRNATLALGQRLLAAAAD